VADVHDPGVVAPPDVIDHGIMASPTDEHASPFRVTENAHDSRFELWRGDELVGYALYHQHGDVVIVPHVETIARHRGNGYGAQLMDGLLEIIAADGRTITPLCSFAAGHIRANADHHALLAR